MIEGERRENIRSEAKRVLESATLSSERNSSTRSGDEKWTAGSVPLLPALPQFRASVG